MWPVFHKKNGQRVAAVMQMKVIHGEPKHLGFTRGFFATEELDIITGGPCASGQLALSERKPHYGGVEIKAQFAETTVSFTSEAFVSNVAEICSVCSTENVDLERSFRATSVELEYLWYKVTGQ